MKYSKVSRGRTPRKTFCCCFLVPISVLRKVPTRSLLAALAEDGGAVCYNFLVRFFGLVRPQSRGTFWREGGPFEPATYYLPTY